jgi:hypothetical protein
MSQPSGREWDGSQPRQRRSSCHNQVRGEVEVHNQVRGNRTGAPRSPKRTWAENDGRSPTIAFTISTEELVPQECVLQQERCLDCFSYSELGLPAFQKSGRGGYAPVVLGPRTLGRTWGTRPIPSDLVVTRPVSFDLVARWTTLTPWPSPSWPATQCT